MLSRHAAVMTMAELTSLQLLPITAERCACKPDHIATIAVSSRSPIRMAAAALLYQDGAHTIIAIHPETDPTAASYRHRVIAASRNAGIDLLNQQAADMAAVLDTDTGRWLPELGCRWPVIYLHLDDYAANKRVKPRTRRRFGHACALRAAA